MQIINPQIKICGITNYEDALFCDENGIDCIGFVFFKKSKRYIDPEKAGEISKKLKHAKCAGIFVDESLDDVCFAAKKAGLDFIQLHGQETTEYIKKLKTKTSAGILKCLYKNDNPGVNLINNYKDLCCGFVVEAEKNSLPGGNGISWDYGFLKQLAKDANIIAAGGITPENFEDAAYKSSCSAFDMSSGVEDFPGIKNHLKIKKIINKAKKINLINKNGRVFS